MASSSSATPFSMSQPSTTSRDSLQRLRTSFFASMPHMSSPTGISPSTSFVTSPLSTSSHGSGGGHFPGLVLGGRNLSSLSISGVSSFNSNNSSRNSSVVTTSSASDRYLIRRKKSIMEIEQEEERSLLSEELIFSLIEPRPRFGPALGGIEEVLSGRI